MAVSRARRRGPAARRGGSAACLILTVAVAAGGCQAAEVGRAKVVDGSGRFDLTVVTVDAEGWDRTEGALDPSTYLDTQWVEREQQCLVDQDAHLEVRDAEGGVLLRHDFADRPVCEHDLLVLGEDDTFTWLRAERTLVGGWRWPV